MKTCTACGLPAPSSTLACALCSEQFPNQGPSTYRLEAYDGGYRWSLDGSEVVNARWRDGTWNVIDTYSGRVAVTLIGVHHDGVTRIAMVDHQARGVATFVPGEPGEGEVGVVRDSYDRVVMAVRADGPTGMHVVDQEGRVLALASRHARRTTSGLDLLLTRAGGTRTESVVFGLSLALELLRSGALVPA